MKYASLLLRKFHWVNLDLCDRLEKTDGRGKTASLRRGTTKRPCDKLSDLSIVLMELFSFRSSSFALAFTPSQFPCLRLPTSDSHRPSSERSGRPSVFPASSLQPQAKALLQKPRAPYEPSAFSFELLWLSAFRIPSRYSLPHAPCSMLCALSGSRFYGYDLGHFLF